MSIRKEEIMQIVHKYWKTYKTMEDLDKAAKKYCDELACSTSKFDIKNLESELERMKQLHRDLVAYDRDLEASDPFFDLLPEEVRNSVHQIVDEFQSIQTMEAYNQFFTSRADKYWIEAILHERTVAMKVKVDDPVVKADDSEKLINNRNKALESNNLRLALTKVCSGLMSLVQALTSAIDNMVAKEKEHKLFLESLDRKTKEEEARILIKEKFQGLCNVMKAVLGDGVENVVVSFECNSPCLMRDSGMGGKTMEINPHDYVIQDLKKRSDADKNDLNVRNATLLLFNYAELYHKTVPGEQVWKFLEEAGGTKGTWGPRGTWVQVQLDE